MHRGEQFVYGQTMGTGCRTGWLDTGEAGGGPRAELLDTRAKVHLTLGQTASAVKDLEQATAENPTAPRYFHLALAHWKAAAVSAER